MLRARSAGAASISVACARLTKAPVAGLPTSSATSSVQKPIAAPLDAAETAKPTPPATSSARRRCVSAATPISGSSRLPKIPGSASARPICP
jgi:hypothetical protein